VGSEVNTELEERARELFSVEYEADGFNLNRLYRGETPVAPAIRAIVKALKSTPHVALEHLLKDFEGWPDNTLVQLVEYDGDEAVAENDDLVPGEASERAATLGQLRSLPSPPNPTPSPEK
jgi:hypothetical protein